MRRRIFRGEGGYARWTRTMAVLLLQGDVEGGVGKSPKGAWWAQGMEAMVKLGWTMPSEVGGTPGAGRIMEDE